MKTYLMIAALLTTTLGCNAIRDPSVYATEIQFIDMTVQRQAGVVHRFLTENCACDESNVWTATSEAAQDSECAAAADWYITVQARWAWHLEMMRYNGRLTDTDPGPVPDIPNTCDLSATTGGEQ